MRKSIRKKLLRKALIRLKQLLKEINNEPKEDKENKKTSEINVIRN